MKKCDVERFATNKVISEYISFFSDTESEGKEDTLEDKKHLCAFIENILNSLRHKNDSKTSSYLQCISDNKDDSKSNLSEGGTPLWN